MTTETSRLTRATFVSLTRYEWLVVALTLATLVKLYLALTTAGARDAFGFADHLVKIRELGIGAYHVRGIFNNPFNSPPFMVHVIKAMGWLADSTGLPFAFWLRLLPIFGGLGSFYLSWRLITKNFPSREQSIAFLAFALCPLSIILDGYHGNTDSLVIFFVILSVYLIETGKSAWLAGLAFGMGCNVKLVPFMFIPAFLLYLPDMKARLRFSLAAAGIFLACSLPFIIEDPLIIRDVVFNYSSTYGGWGFSGLAVILLGPAEYLHPPSFDPTGFHGALAGHLKLFTLAMICIASLWMRWRKVPLFVQCGFITAIFLFLTPGFGNQYLVWLVPFVIALPLRWSLLYYLTASIYAGSGYMVYAGFPVSHQTRFLLGLLAWLSCLIIALAFHRLSAQRADSYGLTSLYRLKS